MLVAAARKLGVSGVSQGAEALRAAALLDFPMSRGGSAGEVLGWSALTARRPACRDSQPVTQPRGLWLVNTFPLRQPMQSPSSLYQNCLQQAKYGPGEEKY